MQEIIIHNWDELQRVVFDDVWDDKIMRYRDNRIYRGMAEQSWDAQPSAAPPQPSPILMPLLRLICLSLALSSR